MEKMRKSLLLICLVAVTILFAGCTQQPSQEEVKKSSPQGLIYIAMGPSDSVTVVDASTNKVISNMPAGKNPHGMGVTPDGKYLYVASLSSDKVSVIDTSTNKIIASVVVGDMSHHVAISPDGRYAYITISSTDTVSVIDTSTNKVVASIPSGKNPNYVAFSPDGKYAYVTNMNSNTVSVVETSVPEVVKTIDVGKMPNHLTVSPNGKYVYLTDLGSDTVSVIDTMLGNVTASINVGKGPHGVGITPDGKKVFVANSGATTFSVIDTSTNKVIDTVEIGGTPDHLDIAPNGNVYINIPEANKTLVIDPMTNKVVAAIDVGMEPHQIAFWEGGVDQTLQDKSATSQTIEVADGENKEDKEDGAEEEELTRTNSEGAVAVAVTFMNPLIKSAGDDLVFKVALNTHTGSISEYKIENLATLKDSEGHEIKEGFTWVSETDSGHHRLGYLKIKQETADGVSLVSKDTKYIVLELRDIGGVSSRVFKWNEEYLKF